MRHIIFSAVFSGIVLGGILCGNASGQRMVGANGLVLDDGASHTITIVPPSISTNYTWQLPVPPAGPAQATGFVPAGTVIGQTLTWNGTQWAATGNASPFLFARKTGSTNFGTSLTNDPDLVVSVSANTTYTFEGYLSFADVGGGSPKIAFTAPSGATLSFGYVDGIGLANSSVPTVISTSGTATPTFQIYNDGTGTNKSVLFVRGLLITGASAGILQLQVAEFGGTIALTANSHLVVTKIQ